MNVLPVLERLRDQAGSDFYAIEAPSQLQALDRQGYPVLQVLPGDESVAASEYLTSPITTLLDCECHVVVIAEAASEALDSDPLDTAIAAVRAALIGYQAAAWKLPLTLVRGEIVALDAGRIAWRDTYSTQRALSATISN